MIFIVFLKVEQIKDGDSFERGNSLHYKNSAKLQAEKNSKQIQLELSNLAMQHALECNKTKSLQAEKKQLDNEKQQLENEKQERENAMKQREKQLEDRLEVCRARMEVGKFRVQIVFPKRERVLHIDVYPWTTYALLESRIVNHQQTDPRVASVRFRLCKENGGDRLWLDSRRSLLENQVHDGDELLLFFDSSSSAQCAYFKSALLFNIRFTAILFLSIHTANTDSQIQVYYLHI